MLSTTNNSYQKERGVIKASFVFDPLNCFSCFGINRHFIGATQPDNERGIFI